MPVHEDEPTWTFFRASTTVTVRNGVSTLFWESGGWMVRLTGADTRPTGCRASPAQAQTNGAIGSCRQFLAIGCAGTSNRTCYNAICAGPRAGQLIPANGGR
jgi:hypothetical protein